MVVSVVTGAAAAGAGAACVVPVAAPPPPTPVVPIGVPCELCWPAPVAAFGLAVVGGVPCAIAVPTTATVARPASHVLSVFDAVMWRLSVRPAGALTERTPGHVPEPTSTAISTPLPMPAQRRPATSACAIKQPASGNGSGLSCLLLGAGIRETLESRGRRHGLTPGACRTWKSSAANRPQRSIFGYAALREHRLFAP